jgi:glycosyltransferase involved in cell wall biosynthesis
VSKGGSILFVVPYPRGSAASQRFRFEQYLPALEKAGWTYSYQSFLSDKAWRILYKPGHFPSKAWEIFKGLLQRISLLFTIRKYDYVFVHRETAPLGPPIFELIAKALGAKLIYDFDDAIWISNFSENNRFFGFLKRFKNTETLCKLAYKVSCGNDYLCKYALQFSNKVVLNPTTIDTVNYHNQINLHNTEHLTIGWTGTHSTIRYLNDLVPVFERLEKEFHFTFRVISDREPDFKLKSLEFIKWNEATEIADLIKIDIGLMPLSPDKWSEGKCGFKALQYMALGIPALVSPVGVNTKIVDHGINGFVCTTDEEWFQALSQLLTDRDLLQEMGSRTRVKIEQHFSIQSNTENFLRLFE